MRNRYFSGSGSNPGCECSHGMKNECEGGFLCNCDVSDLSSFDLILNLNLIFNFLSDAMPYSQEFFFQKSLFFRLSNLHKCTKITHLWVVHHDGRFHQHYIPPSRILLPLGRAQWELWENVFL